MSRNGKDKETDGGWSLVIKPRTSLFAVDFRELWRYQDLCAMLVRRDIVTRYKQAIPEELLPSICRDYVK